MKESSKAWNEREPSAELITAIQMLKFIFCEESTTPQWIGLIEGSKLLELIMIKITFVSKCCI